MRAVDYSMILFPTHGLETIHKGQQWGQPEQYLTFVNGLCDTLTVIVFTVHALYSIQNNFITIFKSLSKICN